MKKQSTFTKKWVLKEQVKLCQCEYIKVTNTKTESMIARIWKGQTKIGHLEEYTEFMKFRAIPDYKKTDGFIKLTFLKRTDSKFAYFKLITFWENLEVIENFAGKDLEKAKYYPEDKNYLIDYPDKVTHYEVFAE